MRSLLVLLALVGVVYCQNNRQAQFCKNNPCDQRCDQRGGNRLLRALDNLSLKGINDILAAPARVDFYMACVLETGTCDGTGNSFREALREWANTKQVCRACNACQTRKVAYIVNALQRSYKNHYDAILTKYGGGRGGK
ncbi:unnamed protein product [Meganyctiphanes norvegica]|uniref:Chemosensory protein n=1 Tax=Meganyctiphanes norvegica TaxID=48144 RepID=A0AAV2QTY0_MEGNR